ncbi:hypothetical protein [Gordonia sp. (in: high G+C Gram-positive bacteria)]|uniref:hypothetical protein n=1 Tax=Gordonia sp. (in: high G+C Gram-positive bacteria) TaxID=84139 RepID=UPI003C7267E5
MNDSVSPILIAIAGCEVGFWVLVGGGLALRYLARLYLGVTVVFGPRLIRWADARFAHRFAGGPAPRWAISSPTPLNDRRCSVPSRPSA